MPPGNSSREQLREVRADVGEGGREHVLDLLVDGADHPGQVATRAAHVLELCLEERVAALQFVELLERQRVDRPEQPQFPVEFADPAGGARAFGKLRHRSGLGDGGFDVEFAAQRLDRRLEPQLGLGLAELGLPGAFAGRFQGPLLLGALATEPIEVGAQRPHLVGLPTALLGEHSVLRLDRRPVMIDDLDQFGDHVERPVDLFALRTSPPPALRRRPRAGDRFRPAGARAVGAVRAARRCGLRCRCGATTAPRLADRVRPAARHGPGPRRPPPARRIRGRAATPPARRPGAARARPMRDVRPSVASSASRSVAQLTQFALRPGKPLGRGAELGVVGVEGADEIGLAALARDRVRSRPRRGHASSVSSDRAAASEAAIASSSAAAVAPELPAPMRHPLRPNRSPLRVTTTASGWSRATSTAVVMSPTQTATPSSPSSNSATPGLDDLTCGRTASPSPGLAGANGRAPSAITAPLVAESRSASRARRPAVGSSTTTAVSDSPSAASTAGPQSSSISTRSSSVPSTPSMPTSRSAPARARAASSASCERIRSGRPPAPRRRHRPPSANAGSR